MEAILNWMKGILILFLIGHVLLYLVQNKTYEKYVHFFVRILILFAVIAPVTRQIVDEDVFIEKIEQVQFFQELKNVQQLNEIEKEDSTYSHMQYEEACSRQVEETLRQKGYDVAYAKVILNDSLEVENMTVGISDKDCEDKAAVSAVEIARIQINGEEEGGKEEAGAYEELETFLCQTYQIDKSQVKVKETKI